MRKFFVLALSVVFMATGAFAQQAKKYSDHYYKRTAQFEQERPINSSDIVMLGDSLTEGGDWASYFADWLPEGVSVMNRGIVGDTAEGIYDRLDQIIPGKPYKLFFLCGANDVSHDLSADTIVARIEKVLVKIMEGCPKTKIYLQSMLPFNESFKRYKKLDGKTYRTLDEYQPKGVERRVQAYKATANENANKIDVSKSTSPIERSYAPVRYYNENGDKKWADIFQNSLFIGMISAFLGFVFCDVSRLWTADSNGLVTVMVTNPETNVKEAVSYTATSGLVPVCVLVVSALVMVACGLLMRKPKMKWLSEYALPISLILGMAAAIPLTAILGMEVTK